MPDQKLEHSMRAVDAETNQRYAKRFAEHGASARSLGWGSSADQDTRFDVILQNVDLRGRKVLDYGCGFGDFYRFARERGAGIAQYTGVDINEEFVEVGRKRFPDAHFVLNRSDAEDESTYCADVVLMIGLFNYQQRAIDHMTYVTTLMRRGFAWCADTLVCDFLSEIPTPGYPREDWVHYYDPGEVVRAGLALSPSVSLRHDYPPNPQREMMLFVRR